MQKRCSPYRFVSVFLSLLTLIFLAGCHSSEESDAASKPAPPAGANAPKADPVGNTGGAVPAKPSPD